MRSLSTRLFTVFVAVLLVLSVLPGVVAAETRTGGTIVVGPDETVTGGLDAFAGDVVVRGTVRGDLNAFAGDVTVAEGGRVTGDVSGFSGSVTVAGVVEGDLSGAAGSVTLTETGRVGGDVAAGAGSVTLAGAVDGNVEVGTETLILTETARVGGDLRYDAGTFRNDGRVEGSVVRDRSIGGDVGPGIDVGVPSVVPEFVLGVYALVVNFLLGAFLLVVFPEFTARTTRYARNEPLAAGGIGLMALVGVPLVLVLLLITIVGIPLSLVGFLLFGLLAWVAAVVGRLAVGEWLTQLADVENRWASLVVGLLAVAVLVRVPWLGGVFDLVVFLLGLGALAAMLYRTYRGQPDEPTADEGSGTPDEGVRAA
jgi:cytoskeletal protein CcmA (bactofilin family)